MKCGCQRQKILISNDNSSPYRSSGWQWAGWQHPLPTFAQGQEVVVLARRVTLTPGRVVNWDGESLGNWTSELENADVLVNLAGRSVDCRYTAANRGAIKEFRVQTTHLLGQAIGQSVHPPRVWMNASTATIYRHALDRPMDEQTGEIGGNEPNAPAKWRFSIDVATSWERAFFEAITPNTRKIALRSAVIRIVAAYLIRCLVLFGLGSEALQPADCNLFLGFTMRISCGALTT
jgi:NAD dependent epimerase/dehydratase family enzyme